MTRKVTTKRKPKQNFKLALAVVFLVLCFAFLKFVDRLGNGWHNPQTQLLIVIGIIIILLLVKLSPGGLPLPFF
jgi:hypothetical protein